MVSRQDLRIYGSANMPEDDTSTTGGAIATSVKAFFDDMAATANIQIVSSSASDTTQTVTVTGRKPSGNIITEVKTLNGTTAVPMTTNTSWERLLKAVKSATTTGDVAVESATATRTNTAQAGTANTITLDAGASATDNEYNGQVIRITGGTGVNQIRQVIDYDGTTKVATVNGDWTTNPDATSVFRLSDGMVFDKDPNEILTCRRILYDIAADPPGGSQQIRYEKIFVRNNHASKSLLSALFSESSDVTGKFEFAVASAVNDTESVANRKTAPTSITSDGFSSTPKGLDQTDLDSITAIGVWVKNTLDAGDAATKTIYGLQTNGTST